MTETPRISEAEWQVMEVLWDESPLGAREVAARLEERAHWTERTVKTLLGRLLNKGALDFEPDGKRYLYHPARTREECVRAEGESFRQRVFGGETAPLLAHFLREGEVGREELEELRGLLRELERRQGGRRS